MSLGFNHKDAFIQKNGLDHVPQLSELTIKSISIKHTFTITTKGTVSNIKQADNSN